MAVRHLPSEAHLVVNDHRSREVNKKNVAMPAPSRRAIYLFDTLKLRHDPFAYATAELELQVDPDDPPFFSYFVDPPFAPGNISLLDKLKEPQPTFIYGPTGSGKTTLRYALETMCRTMPDRTLVTSYTLGKGEQRKPKPISLWNDLAQALATDLFIQIVEQFDTLPTLKTGLVRALGKYWQTIIPHFGRNLQRDLDKGQPEALTGISAWWWKTWKRAAVRYTPLTPNRHTFMRQLLTVEVPEAKITVQPEATFQQGLILARQAGFQQVYLLIDVVDAAQRQSVILETHIKKLLELFSSFAPDIPLYFKAFLPQRMQPEIETFQHQTPLISPSFSAIIEWNNPEMLQTVIANRFRSAGSWIRGFDVLASQEISEKLPQAILDAAQQVPRRLLQVASLLIDAHASRASAEPTITADDWQLMREMWSYSDPKPAPLAINGKGD